MQVTCSALVNVSGRQNGDTATNNALTAIGSNRSIQANVADDVEQHIRPQR